MLVNEKSVTELVGTTVLLPYTASSKAPMLTLWHNNTKTITTGTYEPQASLATFVVNATGQVHFSFIKRPQTLLQSGFAGGFLIMGRDPVEKAKRVK